MRAETEKWIERCFCLFLPFFLSFFVSLKISSLTSSFSLLFPYPSNFLLLSVCLYTFSFSSLVSSLPFLMISTHFILEEWGFSQRDQTKLNGE